MVKTETNHHSEYLVWFYHPKLSIIYISQFLLLDFDLLLLVIVMHVCCDRIPKYILTHSWGDARLVDLTVFMFHTECGAPQLAGAVQGAVWWTTQALPFLPQETSTQNLWWGQTRTGQISPDEAWYTYQSYQWRYVLLKWFKILQYIF